jgi:hypothetical protein
MFFTSKRICMDWGKQATTGLMPFVPPFFIRPSKSTLPMPFHMQSHGYLIFGCSDILLDTIISNLQKDFVLTSQGSVGAYLSICHTSACYLELSQPGLNKIITACGLQDQSTEHTTLSTLILTDDATGHPHENT